MGTRFNRLAEFLYDPKTRFICDQVWQETMDEFSSVGSYEIVQSLAEEEM